MTNAAKDNENSKKSTTKKSTTKASAKEKAENGNVAVSYIRVYNNMRCGWIMPRPLLDLNLKAEQAQTLSRNVIYSKKSRVAPGSSVKFLKSDFEKFMHHSLGVRNLVETQSLKITSLKDSPDSRDWVDAPHKLTPSKGDMLKQDGGSTSVIQTQAVEVTANPSRKLTTE